MPTSADEFGLTHREANFLRGLTPPWRLQKYLDEIDYDLSGKACRSPRRVLRERTVKCLDGGLFAAAALRMQGHPPLILHLEAVQDTDHVLALFRQNGCWGAVARSNFAGLRFREPVYRTLRELVLSYFESYFNLRREKTLRAYSRPCSLVRFDRLGWMTSEENLWYISDHITGVRHTSLLAPRAARSLSPVDRRFFEAGLIGYAKASPVPDAARPPKPTRTLAASASL